MTVQIRFSRRFKIWLYTISHGQLLLRSGKGSDTSTRIDILFKDVVAMKLRTDLDGLSIVEMPFEQIQDRDIQLDDGDLRFRKLYEVQGNNFSGYVVAGAVFSHEDLGEYWDPSHFQILPSLN